MVQMSMSITLTVLKPTNHAELNLNITPLTTALFFGYENQENRDKFKMKTFF